MEFKTETIYCPRCGRAVMRINTKTSMNMSAKCKKCNKLVSYYSDSGQTTIGNIPKRTISSGTRLY